MTENSVAGCVAADHPPGARGEWVVSRFSGGREDGPDEIARHRTVFVSDDTYHGMEDNDIRGYLDGGFVYGWNQPTQHHVRLGRWPWGSPAPRYGEPELFRCLQRWGQLDLPPGAKVTSAELSVVIDDAPDYPVQVFLYRVLKDWDPGKGGEQEDNTSPPEKGEVWWNEARAEEQEWALPGAGFAATDHPDRDTDACPLAEAWCSPDQERLTFSSRPLTEYIDSRIAGDRPCLFLLKLADVMEDRPGSLVDLYSANHGDSMNVDRRPSLTLDWECPAEMHETRCVRLEYGREIPGPTLECGNGDWVASSFRTAEGYESPTIEVSGLQRNDRDPAWEKMRRPIKASGGPLTFRVSAVKNPVTLGSRFQARVRDTWVTKGPPESREVRWIFLSPTGVEHEATGDYQGDYSWNVEFQPDEVGRWRYTWRHDFTSDPYEGQTGVFDIVPADRGSICEEIEELSREARSADDEESGRKIMQRALRLERGALTCVGPEEWNSEGGARVRHALRLLRSVVWGEEVPEPIPLEPHPRPWMNRSSSAEANRDEGCPSGADRSVSLLDLAGQAARRFVDRIQRMIGRG